MTLLRLFFWSLHIAGAYMLQRVDVVFPKLPMSFLDGAKSSGYPGFQEPIG